VPCATPEALLETELAYARRKWRVHPTHSVLPDGTCSCGQQSCNKQRGKHPRFTGWQNLATTDPEQIRERRSRWPNANIAVATGAGSGIVVIDVDDLEALAQLERQHGKLPLGPAQRTGRDGGLQLFFAHPGEDFVVRNKVKLGGRPGVDIRGDGGSAILPPSNHVAGRLYEWIEGQGPDDVPLPALPAEWVALLTEKRAAPTEPAIEHDVPLAKRIERAQKYLAKIQPAIEGNGGDAHTAQVTRTIVRGFDLDEETALRLLEDWNTGCLPPWSRAELTAKIRWAATHCRLPRGYKLTARKHTDQPIRSRADALKLIDDFAEAIELLPTHGRGIENEKAVMRTLVEIARRIGSVRVGLSQRQGAEEIKVGDRKTAGAALRRCCRKRSLRRVPPEVGTRTARWELRPPAEWFTTPECRNYPIQKAVGRVGNGVIPARVIPAGFLSDFDLFRRSYGGSPGLGRRAAELLGSLLAEPAEDVAVLVKRLVWKRKSVEENLARLQDVYLLVGLEPVTHDVEELERLIRQAEEELGLAGATARQHERHVRERRVRERELERDAALVFEALRDLGGRATVGSIAEAIGYRSYVAHNALRWLEREQGAVRRGAKGVWSLVTVERPATAQKPMTDVTDEPDAHDQEMKEEPIEKKAAARYREAERDVDLESAEESVPFAACARRARPRTAGGGARE
jgi:hypothetical protein